MRNLRDRVATVIEQRRDARRARRWVGLDVGSSSIKLAELEQTPAGFRLINTLIQELPAAPGAGPIDRVGWLTSALKEFDVREVHVALGGPEVAVRRIQVPLMPKAELPEAVKWQVREQIPFPVQEAAIDFRVLGEVWDKDIKKQDVLVAAASKAAVQELVALIERAGSHVATLTPSPCALWRSVEQWLPDARSGSFALVEMGASLTHVTIVKDGHVRLVRDIPIGSASLTEALIGVVSAEQGDIAIDPSKAEAFKRRYGVLIDAAEGATEEGIPLFHLASLIRPVMENLLTELSRLLDFYKVQVEGAGVSRIVLCGGGATLKSLQPFLADGLGVTVEVFNPLSRITDRLRSLEPEQVAEGGPRLAVALGLALDHGQGPNLLASSAKRKMLPAISSDRWTALARWLGVAAAAVYAGLWLTVLLLQGAVRHRQAEWAMVEPVYTQSVHLRSSATRYESVLAHVARVRDQQPVWDGLFKELSALVPPAIELDELVIHGGSGATTAPQILLKGHVMAEGTARESRIAALIDALERSIFFKQVELVSSEMRSGETAATHFEIAAGLE